MIQVNPANMYSMRMNFTSFEKEHGRLPTLEEKKKMITDYFEANKDKIGNDWEAIKNESIGMIEALENGDYEDITGKPL